MQITNKCLQRLLLLFLLFYSTKPASITLGLPPNAPQIVAKCGIREYFFLNNQCPWNHVPKIKRLSINGVIRMGTVPESCWYDHEKYILKYFKNGNEKSIPQILPERFTRHPQCHIEINMIVVKQLEKDNGKWFKNMEWNDPKSPGFQINENVSMEDVGLTHHMDDAEFTRRAEETKRGGNYVFVKPKGWQEIDDNQNRNIILRPNPEDFQHIPKEINDIAKFEPLENGWLNGEKKYGVLQFGPILGKDNFVVYDDTGLPKYTDSFQERDYDDLSKEDRPKYNQLQYPNQKEKFVENETPAFCHQKSVYSENTKFIKFLKKGRYLIGYNNLKIDHCIMGVRYNINGMKRMVSDDRYLIVEVGSEFHSSARDDVSKITSSSEEKKGETMKAKGTTKLRSSTTSMDSLR